MGNGPERSPPMAAIPEALNPTLPPRFYHTDGYRDNSDIDRYNTFNKVTVPLGNGDTLTFRAQAYATTSGESGYIRQALQSA